MFLELCNDVIFVIVYACGTIKLFKKVITKLALMIVNRKVNKIFFTRNLYQQSCS